jgi:hypothetical protein
MQPVYGAEPRQTFGAHQLLAVDARGLAHAVLAGAPAARYEHGASAGGEDLGGGVVAGHRDDEIGGGDELGEPGLEIPEIDARSAAGRLAQRCPVRFAHELAGHDDRPSLGKPVERSDERFDERPAVAAAADRGEQEPRLEAERGTERVPVAVRSSLGDVAAVGELAPDRRRQLVGLGGVENLAHAVDEHTIVVAADDVVEPVARPVLAYLGGWIDDVAQAEDGARRAMAQLAQGRQQLEACAERKVVDEQDIGLEELEGALCDAAAQRGELGDTEAERRRQRRPGAGGHDGRNAEVIAARRQRAQPVGGRRAGNEQDAGARIVLDERTHDAHAAADVAESECVVGEERVAPVRQDGRLSALPGAAPPSRRRAGRADRRWRSRDRPSPAASPA